MFKMPDQLVNMLPVLSSAEERESLAYGFVKDPLRFFCPHGGQERFIHQVVDSMRGSKMSTVLCTAGNGWGKTTITVNILLNFIYKPQNGWFDYPCFWNFPYPKLVWVVTTSTSLKNVMLPEILRLSKPGTYKTYNQGKPTVSMIEYENGWRVNFFTTDQGVEQFESATVGMIICDEPVDEPIFKALKSRKRGGNLMLLPMTPLDIDPYIIDEVVSQANSGQSGYYHIEGSVYEASRLNGVGEHCGVRGHLDPDVIDSMVQSYDSDERESRVYGRFMYFSERILGNFREDITVVPAGSVPIDYERDFILQAVDPHDGRESASVWFAVKSDGRVVAFMESPTDKSKPFWEMKRQVSIPDEVRNWYELEVGSGVKCSRRVIDKRFGWQKRGGTNLSTLYYEAGKNIGMSLNFVGSYKNESDLGEIAYGHKIVRQYLEKQENGQSRLVIWDNCWHLINGIKHYVRKRAKTVTELNRSHDENKIIEKYKDFPDVLRYGLVEIDEYVKVIENRQKHPRKKRVYKTDPLSAVI